MSNAKASKLSEARLASIRNRNNDRKAADAQGIIGGARDSFDVDFLLRYIDSQQPRTIETLDELRDYLQDLNYEEGIDHTALTAGSEKALFFAFCTDPDGEWFLETGDPRERFEEEGEEYVYVPLSLDHLTNMGPFTILHEPSL